MGSKARRQADRLLPAAHEDQVGRLQPPGAEHSFEHRTREEAKGPSGVRDRPRNASPDRTDPQREVSHTAEHALPDMARSEGGAERVATRCGDLAKGARRCLHS